MIYVYWILAVPTGLLAVLFIGLTLGGRQITPNTPGWLTVVTCVAVLAFLGWGYTVATSGSRPGLSVLLVLASWVAFFATMLINGLLHQKIWN